MDHERITAELGARRAALQAELDRLTAPREPGAGVGFGKRVGEGTTEAVERLATTATARSIARSLEDLDRALAKLVEGSYGRCDGCGDRIPEPRLAALPAAIHCITCASER